MIWYGLFAIGMLAGFGLMFAPSEFSEFLDVYTRPHRKGIFAATYAALGLLMTFAISRQFRRWKDRCQSGAFVASMAEDKGERALDGSTSVNSTVAVKPSLIASLPSRIRWRPRRFHRYCLSCFSGDLEERRGLDYCRGCQESTLHSDRRQYWNRQPKIMRFEAILKLVSVILVLAELSFALFYTDYRWGRPLHFAYLGSLGILAVLWMTIAKLTKHGYGEFQDSCRLSVSLHAASIDAGSGFRATLSIGDQSRVFPDHRSGFFSFAAA